MDDHTHLLFSTHGETQIWHNTYQTTNPQYRHRQTSSLCWFQVEEETTETKRESLMATSSSDLFPNGCVAAHKQNAESQSAHR